MYYLSWATSRGGAWAGSSTTSIGSGGGAWAGSSTTSTGSGCTTGSPTDSFPAGESYVSTTSTTRGPLPKTSACGSARSPSATRDTFAAPGGTIRTRSGRPTCHCAKSWRKTQLLALLAPIGEGDDSMTRPHSDQSRPGDDDATETALGDHGLRPHQQARAAPRHPRLCAGHARRACEPQPGHCPRLGQRARDSACARERQAAPDPAMGCAFPIKGQAFLGSLIALASRKKLSGAKEDWAITTCWGRSSSAGRLPDEAAHR